jgi:hypothetical protein
MDSIHPRHPGGTAEDEVESIRAPRVPHATPAFFAAAVASAGAGASAVSAWTGGESPLTPTPLLPALTQRSAATLTAIAQADASAAKAKAAAAADAVATLPRVTQRDAACAVTPLRLALAALVAACSAVARSYAEGAALPLPRAMRISDSLFTNAFFLCWLLCRERSRAAAAAWMGVSYLLGAALTGRRACFAS